ncbi:MAG: protein-glutamate O-methyltransferase CheR [Smithella sp.]
MHLHEIEKIEISLLLEAIVQRYGYDFRNYMADSISRRITLFRQQKGFPSIAEMIPQVLHDPAFFQELLQSLSVTVTEMFRDPFVYRSIRENVIPLLQTYPSIRIWVAGCATGEEAYSLAILLKEEGIFNKTTIFATDINDEALRLGKEGIYNLENIRHFTENYQEAGGTQSFSSYYHADYGVAVIDQSLKDKITFIKHNLVTDGVFGEMHLIMCRNVLIYFDRTLQNRVLKLFEESLVYGGYLGLGTKEILRFSAVSDNFDSVDKNARIYKKRRLKIY